MERSRYGRALAYLCSAIMAGIASFGSGAGALAQEPIRIGFSMAITGAYAGNGKAALLAMQMWAEDQNAKGGLLGRPVQLVSYDDQSNPSLVPGIYAKLLDVDKVDFVVSGYGTNIIAPAMPMVMQRGAVFMSFFGFTVNDQFKYDKYFQIAPWGQNSKETFSQGFFEAAMTMDPKPQTVAIIATDSEFPQSAVQGARAWAKKLGLKVVYDRSFPPNTMDFAPTLRGVQAAKPDIVYISSFPPETVGIVRTAKEIGFAPKMMGGGMVGPQYATVKQQLGPLLNGWLSYETYVPEPTLNFPDIKQFLARYKSKAAEAGVDQLGFYLPPYSYAGLQVLGAAVEGTKSLDQSKIAEYIRSNTHSTIVGDVRFGKDGEWAEGRILMVQYQNIVGNGLEQFEQPGKQVIIAPPQYKSGTLRYPMPAAER